MGPWPGATQCAPAGAGGHWEDTRQAGKQMRAFQGFKRAPKGRGRRQGPCEATSSDWLAQVLCQPQDTYCLGLLSVWQPVAPQPTLGPWKSSIKGQLNMGVLQDASM